MDFLGGYIDTSVFENFILCVSNINKFISSLLQNKIHRKHTVLSIYPRFTALFYSFHTVKICILLISALSIEENFVEEKDFPSLTEHFSDLQWFVQKHIFMKIPLAVNATEALSPFKITSTFMRVDCQAHKCRQLLSGQYCQTISSFNM